MVSCISSLPINIRSGGGGLKNWSYLSSLTKSTLVKPISDKKAIVKAKGHHQGTTEGGAFNRNGLSYTHYIET